MKFNHFMQTIPLAVAMHSSQPTLPAKISAKNNHVAKPFSAVPYSASFDVNQAALLVDPKSAKSVTHTVERIMRRAPRRWEEISEEYNALVTKEALGSISQKELAELERLQKVRRRLQAPPTGEEVLVRYRREKLDQQLVTILQRHVRVEKFGKSST